MNKPSPFRPVTDITEANWLKERIEPGRTVTSLVPTGFDAYARLFHPVEDAEGNKITWKQIALRFGRIPHPMMQFHAIVSPAFDAGDSWYEPDNGNLDHEMLRGLCSILREYTTTPEDNYLCLWTGYGWHPLGSPPPVIELYERDYYLFMAPLEGALRLGRGMGRTTDVVPPITVRLTPVEEDGVAHGFDSAMDEAARSYQSPNIFWPSDRAWCVASEIDLVSTYVGGSDSLISAVVASSDLEALRVDPGDLVTRDSDEVNI